MGRNRKRARAKLRKAARNRAVRAETIRQQGLASAWTDGGTESSEQNFFDTRFFDFRFLDEQDSEPIKIENSRPAPKLSYRSESRVSVRHAQRSKALDLLGRGVSARKTAEEVGVSATTVSKWAKLEGYSLREDYLQTAQNRRREVRRLHDEGLSGKAISKRLRISESLVSLTLRGGKRKGFNADELEVLRAEVYGLLAQEFSTRQVAAKLGISRSTVSNWARELGIKLPTKPPKTPQNRPRTVERPKSGEIPTEEDSGPPEALEGLQDAKQFEDYLNRYQPKLF